MHIRFLLIISLVSILFACSKQNDIVTISSRSIGDGKGHDTIRWETFPLLDKTVKIYSYLNPDYPEFRSFEKEVSISDGSTVISSPKEYHGRKYYYLLFDDTYPVFVANRVIKADSILNLRDLGGYVTANRKTIKWGKLFSSGRIQLTEKGKDLFNSLHIRTVIDLRSDEEWKKQKGRGVNANVVRIPIEACDISNTREKLKNNELKRDDATVFMQDAFKSMAMDYQEEFSKMFEILLDSINYPILISCNAGNDRCSFASALILSALGVSHDQIVEDYLSTYSIPNIRIEGHYAFDFSPEAQEAVTVLLSSDKKFIDAAFKEINTYYGSVEHYLKVAMKLDVAKRARLQRLLLTNGFGGNQ